VPFGRKQRRWPFQRPVCGLYLVDLVQIMGTGHSLSLWVARPWLISPSALHLGQVEQGDLNVDECCKGVLDKISRCAGVEAGACAMIIFPRPSHLRPAFSLSGRVLNCPYAEMALGSHLSPEVPSCPAVSYRDSCTSFTLTIRLRNVVSWLHEPPISMPITEHTSRS
jgi:hypothetical protein